MTAAAGDMAAVARSPIAKETDMTQRNDGVSDPQAGKGESGGGAWKGGNEKPAHPDEGVVTHDARETADAKDRPVGGGNSG